jgi:hypothetical protein
MILLRWFGRVVGTIVDRFPKRLAPRRSGNQ